MSSAYLETARPIRRESVVAVSQPEPGWLSPWVYGLAVIAILLHFLFNRGYGYFRDELYYAACGQRLAWGYVDHAPLIALVSRVTRACLGDSLGALRFVPALSGGAKVLLGGWIAREMGGRRFAQVLAALTVLTAPVYLTFDNFLSMNALEPVFWAACAAIVVRILNGGDRRLWLLFGAVAGLGILNKHSMLFFGSGVALGLLATPARREFARIWIWLGAGVALVFFLPNLLWEIHNGWPTIALLHTVIGGKYSSVAPWDYVWQQSLLTNPMSTPIWVAGLWFLLGSRRGRVYAALGWAYLVVLVEMLVLHGKIYYLAPAYVMLLAAGAVWWQRSAWLSVQTGRRAGMIAVVVVAAVVSAPLAMPILPVDLAIRYSRFWDVQAVHVENVPQDELPQLFGDMFGWQQQVQAVAEVYKALPASERASAAILAYNYGEAGAIDYFGGGYGLPKAISGHNQYGFWGPGRDALPVVVAIGFQEATLRGLFEEVEISAHVSPAHVLPEERNLNIFVCRRPKLSVANLWRRLMYLN